MADIKIDGYVDITDVVCPVTFVKAKVAIEELEVGQVLSVHMNDGEPVQNVPRSMKEEGHKVLKLNRKVRNNKMKLTVSGQTKEYKEGLTVAELVVLENVETPEYATAAVNDDLHSARDFENIVLKDGDVVEFLYFMGGGCR